MGTNILTQDGAGGSGSTALSIPTTVIAQQLALTDQRLQRVLYDAHSQDQQLSLPTSPHLGDTVLFERSGQSAALLLGQDLAYALTITPAAGQLLWGNAQAALLERAAPEFQLTWDGASWV